MIIAENYPYTGNGLGGLPDTIEAIVTHEINGIYELFLSYPVTGTHYEELISGRIIMAEPDDLTDAQPFRIYRITKPLNGIVSVYARHLCYDLQGIIVEPFTAGSMTEAFQTIPTKCTPALPITLQTTRTVASGIKISEPRPLWKLLGGQSGSLLDVYGGEWDFDKLTATLVTKLGIDRGVSIRYGKNMTEMAQDASIEGSYSSVYPYWYDEGSNILVTLTEKIVSVSGSVVSNRVLVLDCSADFDDAPTEAQLRTLAENYITANSIGNVAASWKISFVDTTEGLDRVMLGDTLHVYYERLDVNATARAVKVEYNVLQKRYKSITVGRVKQNLAAIIVQNQEQTASEFAKVKSDLENAVDGATDFIRNGAGYMRLIYDGDILKEIVSLDDPDITQAQKVWRWNNGGFGFSSTGYNGTYSLAITQNGAIVADFITAGTLNANVIRAGILQDAAGKNSWNLDTGELTIRDGKIVVTFTITYDHNDYSSEDLTVMQNFITGSITFTDDQWEKYSINGDGTFRNSDLIKIRNMINYARDIVKTVTVTINPADTTRAIKVETNVIYPTDETTGTSTETWSSYYDGESAKVPRGEFTTVNGAYFGKYATETNARFFGDIYPGQSINKYSAPISDFVIEQGTVSAGGNTWFVRKWDSGRCECYFRRELSSLAMTTAWGRLYTSSAFSALTYPVTFKAAPHEIVTVCGSSSTTNGSAWLIPYGNKTGPTTTKSGQYQAVRATSSTASLTVEYYVMGTV